MALFLASGMFVIVSTQPRSKPSVEVHYHRPVVATRLISWYLILFFSTLSHCGDNRDIVLFSWENNNIDIWVAKLSDFEYSDDVVTPNEDPSMWQVFIDRPRDSMIMFGMRLASSKCKIRLWDWTSLWRTFVLATGQLNEVDRFRFNYSVRPYAGWTVLPHAGLGIRQVESFVQSIWWPFVDRRWGIHGSSEVDAFVRVRNMTLGSGRCTKIFGVSTS